MARAGLRSLPRNMTDVTRVLLRLDAGVRNGVADSAVLCVAGQAELRGCLVVEYQR